MSLASILLAPPIPSLGPFTQGSAAAPSPVPCTGDFHFWDAPDDISGARLELVLERDRLYLHHARGFYGAVPLTVSGDMDLNPRSGVYRLQVGHPWLGWVRGHEGSTPQLPEAKLAPSVGFKAATFGPSYCTLHDQSL